MEEKILSMVVLAAGKTSATSGSSASERLIGHDTCVNWNTRIADFSSGGVHLVTGYGAGYERFNFEEEMNVFCIENKNWMFQGSAGSLLSAVATLKVSDCIVVYGDVLVESSLVREALEEEGDIVIVKDIDHRSSSGATIAHGSKVDQTELFEFDAFGRIASTGKLEGSFHFSGVCLLSQVSIAALKNLTLGQREELAALNLLELCAWLESQGFELKTVDSLGRHANLDDRSSLTSFVLKSKAQGLETLRRQVRNSTVLPSVFFTYDRWIREQDCILNEIHSHLGACDLAVRSSSRNEDSITESNAGKYDSYLFIRGRENTKVAIEQVFASYGAEISKWDEVLVQPMATDVSVAGVCLTRSKGTGAPWITIEFNSNGDTAAVTTGTHSLTSQIQISRRVAPGIIEHTPSTGLPPWVGKFLESLRELENLTFSDSLDVEFAVTDQGEVIVLQVRPIALATPMSKSLESRYLSHLRSCRYVLSNLFDNSDERILLSNMADWNPAEMIGFNPSTLAHDLYARLITNSTWAESREQMGYSSQSGRPLMQMVGGHPYIFVNRSLDSLVPAGLVKSMRDSLVQYGLKMIEQNPGLHDKIEFATFPNVLHPNIDSQIWSLVEKGVIKAEQQNDYVNALTSTTSRILASGQTEVSILADLKSQTELILSGHGSPTSKLTRLLELICNRGALPFANLARKAFASYQIIDGAAQSGLIGNSCKEALLSSVRTVSSQFLEELRSADGSKETRDLIVSRYGHLRPGTYDLTAPRYDSDPDRYFNWGMSFVSTSEIDACCQDKNHLKGLEAWIKNHFATSAGDDPIGFLLDAIQAREWGKFEYSRGVSELLEFIASECEVRGMTRQNVKHMYLREIYQLFDGNHASLPEVVKAREEQHHLQSMDYFPDVLVSTSGLEASYVDTAVTNYVGKKPISAALRFINGQDAAVSQDLKGAIVAIESADPGYDWIFSGGISGLITKYGGANSHMAVRAAEFELPAAIGVGHSVFEALRRFNGALIDPSSRFLTGVH